MNFIAVGVGGAIGSLLRFLVGIGSNHLWNVHFPLGTLIANLLGCFILGWFTSSYIKMKKLHPHILTGVGTGMIGSFTTFSTFSVESVQLMQENHYGTAYAYIMLSMIGGLFMSWLGYKLETTIKKPAAAERGDL
ncbi:fluoride efflux transporter CrcB [Falsibacillus albus]|uniref:Fluoride-specific ion channel FluC n=1 Tax=Falsibacillus albus TaxID=2478915 RepID=A0A3L7JSS3_9BACI|nr:fluoride efflux transporter CrcB [Falsibacillus albus]RLQ93756.1 fluoride efflux transporter CrcB [Falsibacillus albus]